MGPHRHGVETIVYVAAGELTFEHGEGLEQRATIGAGDVLYEAPAEYHLVRNDGTIDALALLASNSDDSPADLAERRWNRTEAPVRRRSTARVIEAGGIRRRLLVEQGDFDSPTFTVEEVELEPGVVDAWHRHRSAEHALVVFEGRGTITVGHITETLEPLKGIRIEAGLAHRVENTGRTMLRYYVCATPGTDMLSDREGAAAPRRERDA